MFIINLDSGKLYLVNDHYLNVILPCIHFSDRLLRDFIALLARTGSN